MQPHIAKTIEDIELKIGFLQRLADCLRTFDSPSVVGAAIPCSGASATAAISSASPARNGATPPLKIRKSKLLMRACKPRAGSSELFRMAGIVDNLREPFGAMTIASAAKVETKKASNFITQSLAKGWLTRLGHGEYSRSKAFPKANSEKSAGEKMLSQIHEEIAATKPKED